MIRIPPHGNVFSANNTTTNTISQHPPLPDESFANTKSLGNTSPVGLENKKIDLSKRPRSNAIYVKPEADTYIGITKEEFKTAREHTKSIFLGTVRKQQ